MKRTFIKVGEIKFTKDRGFWPYIWKAEVVGEFRIPSSKDNMSSSASVWAEAFGRTKGTAKKAVLELVRA
jgi:hypothetical protein